MSFSLPLVIYFPVPDGQAVSRYRCAIGLPAMLWLLLRGALGQLGEAHNVVNFAFERLTVRPYGRARIKVAVDGEVDWLNAPLVFRVAPETS